MFEIVHTSTCYFSDDIACNEPLDFTSLNFKPSSLLEYPVEFNAVVKLRCKEGFIHAEGSDTFTCTADDTFSNIDMVCETIGKSRGSFFNCLYDIITIDTDRFNKN